ncbi:hypothetical protein QYF36_021897 [Acer negundo]|nr:hypothetical protein QYF36_021897 [Acer negundo]
MTNLPFFHRVESCQRSDVTPGGVFQIALLFERQRRLLKAKGNMWTPRCFTAQTKKEEPSSTRKTTKTHITELSKEKHFHVFCLIYTFPKVGSGCSLSFSLLSSPSSSFFCDKAVISESANLA